MKRKQLILCAGFMILLLLLCAAAGAARAEEPPKSAAEWQAEGYTVADLSDTIYDSTGIVVLNKDVTYLKETVKDGISRSDNQFSLASGNWQKTAAPDGQQTKYCILSGGRLFFGDRNGSSGSETIILDNLHELNPAEIFLGGDKPRDQMMLQAVVGQAAEGADPEKTKEELSRDLVAKLADLGDPVKFIFFDINQDFDVNIDFIEDVLPFYAKGNFTLYGEYRYDNPGMFEYSMHDIHVYVDLNVTDIGIKSSEVVTDTYERAIITVYDWLDLATVKAVLRDFIGEVAWYMHGHFGFKIHFETFYGPVATDDWYCKLDDDNMFDMGIAHVKGKGDLELGITVGPSVTLDQFITHTGFGGKMDFGFAMTNKGSPDRFKPADTKDEWHICDECVTEEIRSFAGPSYVYLDLPFSSDYDLEWDFSDRVYSDPIKTFYFSNTFDECEDGDCPHWAWHTPTTVESSDHHDYLKDVSVSYTTVPSHCDPYASGTTGEDGGVDLYMPPGDYTIKAEAQSPLDPKWKISDELKYTKNDGDPYGALLTLDIPINYVYFKNSQTGTATDWPEDIRFSPFYRQDIQLPDKVPVLSGRQFIEWNTKEDGTGTAYAPGTTLTLDDDLTLWAQWEMAGDSWYVVYNAHGGTWAPSPDIVGIGSDAIVKEAAESDTMRFEGWSTDPEATEAEYQPGDTLKYDNSRNVVILYAIWQLNPPGRPWVLSFRDSLTDPVSGLPNPMSIDPSVSMDVIIPSDIPEKSGRLFTGWNTAQDGSGKDYAPGSEITLTGDTTLWAQWTLAENTWVLVYNANGGTGAPSPSVIRQDYVAIISVEKPEHGSMKFLGWALSPDATEAEYQSGDLFHNTEGKPVVILYALWELSPGPRPIHIAFDANGLQDAGLPADIWQDPAWVRLEPAVAPLGSEYMFRGWSKYSGTKDPEYRTGHPYYFDRDTVLYAIWDKQETVTLTFQDSLTDSVSGIPDPITIVPSESKYVRIPSQIPQKSGRVFAGWNTAKDGKGTKYAPGSVITLLKDTTLWAQWNIAGNSWYIVYDANGGTKAPDTQIITRGKDAVLTKELPENGSLTFMGWATDPDAAAAEYQPGDTLKYDSGKNYVVLYALWELDPAKRPVTVSFDANGGLPDTAPKKITVPKGIWVQLPAQQPSWDAQHDFLGWSANQKATEPQWKAGSAVVVNQDTTLYAVWNAHYKVIEGAGSVWTKGSGKPQRFVADGNRKYFVELRVDGLPFNEGVEISSGSTVAYINAKAMEKLSVGNHTVTFVYIDGTASAPFKVRTKIPPTGDAGHPALWLTLVMLGIAGLILPGMLSRSARRKK